MNEITEKLKDQQSIGATFAGFIDVIAEVPFGNSDYQNRQAIVNDELTPMRAYRHAALRITNRLNALMESYYHLRRTNIEIQKLERGLALETDELERELLQIDIEQKRAGLPYTKKLVADAIREIESLYPVIETLGKVTREQFELEEGDHFAKKLGVPAQIAQQADDLYQSITGIVSAVRALPDK